MEIVDPIETLVKIYQTTRLYLARDRHVHNHRPNPRIFSENFS